MRDPLDPQNPYKGKYAAYDVWIYANAWQQAQGQPIDWQGQGQRPGEWYSMAVDANGWPVPQKLDLEREYQPHRDKPAQDGGCRRAISAFGYMGRGLAEMQQQDLLAVQAKALAPIPRWLAANPPLGALLLPDGEVVARGALGSGLHTEGGETDEPGLTPYYRYNATGVELANVAGTEPWWELYFSGYPQLVKAHPGSRFLHSMGYITRYDEDGNPHETYDYTGQLIHGQPPFRGNFDWLSGDSLRQLYDLQTGGHEFAPGAASI